MRYLGTWEKIRGYLLSKISREFLIFLFFVFVSFTFWLLQVLNDDYETELSIPLRIKNVPENVIITSELPKELKIGVKDRGTVLVNYLFGKTLYPVNLDFKDYADKGNVVKFSSHSLEKRIASQLNQSTKFSSIKPDTLEFIYTEGEAKKLPVKIQGTVKADRQYYISEVVCQPDSVVVYAPREILDTMTAAFTKPVNIKQITDTTRVTVDVMPVKGARFATPTNNVTFVVDMFAEKTVEVPVRGVNFPDNTVLRTFPSRISVSFQVGLTQFKNVTADDFDVVVDYKAIQSDKSDKCKPFLVMEPEIVNNVRLRPNEIDYIIEKKVVLDD